MIGQAGRRRLRHSLVLSQPGIAYAFFLEGVRIQVVLDLVWDLAQRVLD